MCRVLDELRSVPAGALFATELVARLRPDGLDGTVDAALERLAAGGEVVVTDNPAPDRHLEGLDMRVVALVTEPTADARAAALRAANDAWNASMRLFLASHRCT